MIIGIKANNDIIRIIYNNNDNKQEIKSKISNQNLEKFNKNTNNDI